MILHNLRGVDIFCILSLVLVELVAFCHTLDQGVKTNDEWTMLREKAMTAVLVELAFLMNDAERAALRQLNEGLVLSVHRQLDHPNRVHPEGPILRS